MRTRAKPTPEHLQDMISGTYAEIPHADAHRLEAIGQRVRPLKAIECPRRSQASWWTIGLVLVASGAAAWWTIHNNMEREAIPSQEPSARSSSTLPKQSFDAVKTPQSLISEIPEDDVLEQGGKNGEQPLSQSSEAKEQKNTKNSSVIFQREIF